MFLKGSSKRAEKARNKAEALNIFSINLESPLAIYIILRNPRNRHEEANFIKFSSYAINHVSPCMSKTCR